MKKNQTILIIVGIFILIGLVSSFSFWLGQQSVKAKLKAITPNFFESKVTQNWEAIASGEITEIVDQNITLRKDGDTLAIQILEEATIKSLSFNQEGRKSEEIRFEDITVGDRVDIQIEVTPEGIIVGNSITVLFR